MQRDKNKTMAWQSINKRLYLYNSRLPALFFAMIDFIGQWTIARFISRKGMPEPSKIKKILVSRPDHLGDLVMTTAVLPLIKQSFPHASIHMLAGSWSKELLENIGEIEKTIYYDNFYLNRKAMSGWKKILTSLFQILPAVKTLRDERYDLGIEFRPFFGNNIFLMWLGEVKYRVGYGTAGLGFLLH
ncbi:MAG: glycosyltransferase family 9 protein, partial [Smithellaceae bacterium]